MKLLYRMNIELSSRSLSDSSLRLLYQLSEVGFSSTQKTEVVVRVTGKVSRVLRVVV